MATEIEMPQMGFDMTEGTVAGWLKRVGDPIKKGEPIAEIETDKTTIQVEAFASGTLLSIEVEAGQKVPVKTVIGIIGAVGELAPKSTQPPTAIAPPKVDVPASSAALQPAVAPSAPPVQSAQPVVSYEGATEIEMPQMGFDMTEGTVASWLKQEGDKIKKGEPIAEIETDKTTIQVEAFASGILLKILVQAGAKVPVKTAIGLIGDPAKFKTVSAPPTVPAVPALKPATSDQPVSPVGMQVSADATPVARRMAEEFHLDLRKVTGTGPEGRITKGDVEAAIARSADVIQPANGRIVASPYARTLAAKNGVDLATIKGTGPAGRIIAEDVLKAPKTAAVAAPANIMAIVESKAPPTKEADVVAPTSGLAPATRVALSRMRQTIARRMTESKTTVPHYYLTMQVEMDAALTLRGQINESLKSEGIKVSVNDLVVKASAGALRKFPHMNATFAGDAIDLRESINIGIAVAIDSGLLVITLKDADKKTLKQIGAEVPMIANRVRDGKAQTGDLGGQTFTTSNLGMHGVESVFPIINQPDSGILGIGASAPTPVVRDGQIVIRNVMSLVLAGDHRVTDGAEGAQFLGEIKRLLENPWGLVL